MSSTNTSTNDLQYNSGDFAPVPADNGDNEIASTAHLLPGPDLSNAATITSGADSFWSSFQTLPLPDHSYGDTLGPSLFDSILNPAGLNHGRYSPFAYNPLTLDHAFPTPDTMPASTRLQAESSQRPARLPNGYVDLTASPDSPPRRRKPSASSPGPSNKRRKREDGTAAEQEIEAPPEVEEVDLTQEADPIQEILQKQRADAIKAQEKPEETRTTFNTFNCVICMDNPTDLTATACGTVIQLDLYRIVR